MNQRYQRQMVLEGIGHQGQAKLEAARVLCIGAGGLASTLTLYLAGVGVGCIGIIDGDRIDVSNLHRQVLYRDQDVGLLKGQVAAQVLQERNPHIQVDTYPYFLDETNALDIISSYDIVADCTDRFSARYLINDACMTLSRPNVFASAQQFHGYCTVFPGDRKGPCYRCWFPEPPKVPVLNCSQGGVLATVPGVLGCLQANEMIKWLLGMPYSVGKVCLFNAKTGVFSSIGLQQSSDCPICAQGMTFKQLLRAKEEDGAHDTDVSDFLVSASIGSQELMGLLKKKEPFLLVDVRSDSEFYAGHLSDIHIPLDQLYYCAKKQLNMEDKIILYCQSGVRSRKACEILLKMGYKKVFFINENLRNYEDAFRFALI